MIYKRLICRETYLRHAYDNGHSLEKGFAIPQVDFYGVYFILIVMKFDA